MEKYEEYDKTYNDAELNDIINNYNEQIDVVHNDKNELKYWKIKVTEQNKKKKNLKN